MALFNEGKRRTLEGLLAGTTYIALFNGSSEVSGGGYRRQGISLGQWTRQANFSYRNSITIAFPEVTSAYSFDNVTIMTTASGGEKIIDRAVTRQSLAVNDAVKIAVDSITITAT